MPADTRCLACPDSRFCKAGFCCPLGRENSRGPCINDWRKQKSLFRRPVIRTRTDGATSSSAREIDVLSMFLQQ